MGSSSTADFDAARGASARCASCRTPGHPAQHRQRSQEACSSNEYSRRIVQQRRWRRPRDLALCPCEDHPPSRKTPRGGTASNAAWILTAGALGELPATSEWQRLLDRLRCPRSGTFETSCETSSAQLSGAHGRRARTLQRVHSICRRAAERNSPTATRSPDRCYSVSHTKAGWLS